jgi:CheY-like chemotaxis protein
MSMISCTQARLLVVDDSEVDRLLLSEILRSLGFDEVIMARNAEEAILLLQDEEFQAVFTDIEMPVINGLLLLGTIRTDLMQWALPVFLVSSLNSAGTDKTDADYIQAFAHKFEAAGLIGKPINSAAVEGALRHASLL